MRIAVVGPTHPYKGGVAAHTTHLAHHLAADGHGVELVSWSRQYPRRLYPGQQRVPGGVAEVEPFPRTSYPLRWDRPASWLATGRRLRRHDLVVIPLVVPVQVPALLAIARAAAPARVVVIAHNVEPHEAHRGSRRLVAALLRRADAVLVHSPHLAAPARGLGARAVEVAELPPHLPGRVPPFARRRGRCAPHGRLAVLALGIVREYKGVDLLLRAAAAVPDVAVCVAGELWGGAGEEVRRLAGDVRLAGRVELVPGYVPAQSVAPLLARHDVLALTYRSATASQNPLLAFAHGLPVLASDVGSFAAQVRDDVDGVLVPPGEVGALESALRQLRSPGVLERLQAGVQPVDLDSPWRAYVQVLTGAGLRGEGGPGDD